MSPVTRLRNESGQSLVVAVIVLMVILMLGAAALQTANVESDQTGQERSGENAFNLAESALNAEVAAVQRNWPSSSSTAFPVCTQSSTTSSTCPEGAIAAGFNTTYAGSGFKSPTWSVQVIDDNVSGVADSGYYSDSILTNSSLAHYDSNSDNKVWVRATATLNGQKSTMVSEVSRQKEVVWLPLSVITSGGVTTSNNGNKIIIEATDPNSGLTGPIDLRCGTTTTTAVWGSSCAGWDPNHGQLDPAGAYQGGYTDATASYQTLTSGEIELLRESAQSSGTYYASSCPTQFTTGVLFIENANCSYTSNGTWNSDAAPGAIFVDNGTLTFGGGLTFYGIIYLADAQGSVPSSGPCTSAQSNNVFTIQGSATIHGGLFIDKCGTATVGSSGNSNLNISFDSTAFGGLTTYETPSIALSTFRVLANG